MPSSVVLKVTMTLITVMVADNDRNVSTHSIALIRVILSICSTQHNQNLSKTWQWRLSDGDISETEGRLGIKRLESGLVNLKGSAWIHLLSVLKRDAGETAANLVHRSQREGEPHLDFSNAVLLVEQIHHCDLLAWYYPHTCFWGMHVKRRSGVSAKRRDGVVRKEEGST